MQAASWVEPAGWSPGSDEINQNTNSFDVLFGVVSPFQVIHQSSHPSVVDHVSSNPTVQTLQAFLMDILEDWFRIQPIDGFKRDDLE